MQETLIQTDSYAIPIPHVRAALDTMPYASQERVMFQMLHLTGCRLACLDKMLLKNLHGQVLYWQPSKNQHGWRKETLPIEYLAELRAYRESHPVPSSRFFGITGESFRRYFNMTRRSLPKAWREKRLQMTVNGPKVEYWLQLKGLRKNFQTFVFKQELDTWGDPGIAIDKTAHRMRHSVKNITAQHYVENFDVLGVRDLPSLDPAILTQMGSQRRLLDFVDF